jgi:hypothetical protein
VVIDVDGPLTRNVLKRRSLEMVTNLTAPTTGEAGRPHEIAPWGLLLPDASPATYNLPLILVKRASRG